MSETTLKKGVLFLSLEKGLNGTITILLIPVMIRSIGVEHFGFWGILLGLVYYIQCLDFGVSLSIERHVAFYATNNDQKSLENLLSTAFTMLVIIALVLAVPILFGGEKIIGFLAKGSIDLSLREVVVSIYPAVFTSWITYVFIGVPRGLQRFDISSIIQIIGKVTFAVALVILLIKFPSVRAVIYAFNIQCLVVLVLYVFVACKLLPSIRILKLSINWKMLKQMVNFGYKIQISALSSLINQQFDKILLASFYNLAVVGYYDAASRIVFAIKDIPHFLVSVLTSRVSSLLAAGNDREIRELFIRVTGALAVVGFYLSGAMLINSNLIIEVILKKEINTFSVQVFSILSVAALWQAMAAGAIYIARGIGKTQIEMNTTVFVLVINVIASYSLIRLARYQGVVFGTGIAMVIAPLLSYYLLCKEFRMPFRTFLNQSFSMPVFSFICSVSIVILLRNVLPVSWNRLIAMSFFTMLFLLISHSIYSISKYRPYADLVEVVGGIAVRVKGVIGKLFSG